MTLNAACRLCLGYLLPASPYIFGEGGALSYSEHLLTGQVLGHWEAGHYYLVQLVRSLDVEKTSRTPITRRWP